MQGLGGGNGLRVARLAAHQRLRADNAGDRQAENLRIEPFAMGGGEPPFLEVTKKAYFSARWWAMSPSKSSSRNRCTIRSWLCASANTGCAMLYLPRLQTERPWKPSPINCSRRTPSSTSMERHSSAAPSIGAL